MPLTRVYLGGTSSNTTVLGTFETGGVDNDATVDQRAAMMTVKPGGVANETAVQAGYFVVQGTSNDATVTGESSITISRNGVANNMVVDLGVRSAFQVNAGGTIVGTVRNTGEISLSGKADGTQINGGAMIVKVGGEADDTTIVSGVLDATEVGGAIAADKISFLGPNGVARFQSMANLFGSIGGWSVSDTIDLVGAKVTAVSEQNGKLTVTDNAGAVRISLVNKQADTAVSFQALDGTGSQLILVDKRVGTAADEVLLATSGTDYLTGLGGSDVLYGDASQAAGDLAGQTVLEGDGGSNALYGASDYTVFKTGDADGGVNQIWGAASKMAGVEGYTNNTLSYEDVGVGHSVYVDLLTGHNGYINSGANNDGAYTLEDSISNVPNVIGSSGGDIIIADNGVDRIEGAGGADTLYAGGGADTFVYSDLADSNLVTGYDTVINFKIGADKIDLSAFGSDPSHLLISTNGVTNTLYLETTPGVCNPATDLAINVIATTTAGLTAADVQFGTKP